MPVCLSFNCLLVVFLWGGGGGGEGGVGGVGGGEVERWSQQNTVTVLDT